MEDGNSRGHAVDFLPCGNNHLRGSGPLRVFRGRRAAEMTLIRVSIFTHGEYDVGSKNGRQRLSTLFRVEP